MLLLLRAGDEDGGMGMGSNGGEVNKADST